MVTKTKQASSSPKVDEAPEIDTTIRIRLDTYAAEINSAAEALHLASRSMARAVIMAKENGGKATDYATIYAAIYRGDAALAAATKPLGDLFGELKNVKVPEAFERDDIKTLTMADGARITISNVVRASVIGGKKEEAFAWLRTTDQADLITETLNSSTLTAFAKSLLEQNKSLPDDLFNVVVMPSVSLTGSKKK